VNERLRITHGDRGEVILAGEIDEGTAHRLHTALQQAGAAEPILVVDLCAVHHLQSAGISVFFQHARSNLRLRVRADSGVATVIRICGLSEIVPVDFVATKR
jgi:anti-anti-sigma factor